MQGGVVSGVLACDSEAAQCACFGQLPAGGRKVRVQDGVTLRAKQNEYADNGAHWI